MFEKVISSTGLKLLEKSTQQLARQHLCHAEFGSPDAVVRHAVVFKVVCTNFLGTIPAADLGG